MYTVADYIAEFLVALECTTIHGLMGGGAAGLNGFIKHPRIDYLYYHHEQGAGYGALGEARLTGRWGIVNPTTGCGGSGIYAHLKCMAGLHTYSRNIGKREFANVSKLWLEDHNIKIRSYGVQEHDIVLNVGAITSTLAS